MGGREPATHAYLPGVESKTVLGRRSLIKAWARAASLWRSADKVERLSNAGASFMSHLLSSRLRQGGEHRWN